MKDLLRILPPALLIVAMISGSDAQEKKPDAKPGETKSTGAKPAETKPAGAKPAETKPAGAKPGVANNAAAKPAAKLPIADEREKNACIYCHTTQVDVWDSSDPGAYKKHIPQMAVDLLKGDVHWQKGLRCQDCHGGDATMPANPKEDPDKQKAHQGKSNFRTVETAADIPAFCGRCHSDIDYMRRFNPSARTDQLSEYLTSGHGKHLKQGDLKVAVCTSCHDRPHGNAVDLHSQLAVAVDSSAIVLSYAGLTISGTNEHARWKSAGDSSATLAGDSKNWTLKAGASSWKAPVTNYPWQVPASGSGAWAAQGQTTGTPVVRLTKADGILAVNEPASPVYHTKVAETCSKCHSDKQLMAGRSYNGKPLPCDEYDKWRGSVHGQALLKKGDFSAPACNNCHGNHGAAPPQMDSVANACGACHGKIATLFAATRMRHKFQEVKPALPGCATCHGNHDIRQPSDDFLGMQEGAFCARCHTKGKEQYGATAMGREAAKTIHAGLETLKQGIRRADATLQDAETKGMEVSEPKFNLKKASDALTNARTEIHSFNVDEVKKALDPGEKVVAEVQGKADRALKEYQYRRYWLAVSLVPILLVIALLLLYIRTLPIPQKPADAEGEGAAGK